MKERGGTETTLPKREKKKALPQTGEGATVLPFGHIIGGKWLRCSSAEINLQKLKIKIDLI